MNNELYQRISSFKLIRWKDLPELDLYMDQVLEYVNGVLAPLFPNSAVIITASMVNNYVKQKLISKPHNKRYRQGHIASLIAITILKPIYSISTISDGLRAQRQVHGDDVAFDMFCEAIEGALLALSTHIDTDIDIVPLLHAKILHDDMFVELAAVSFAARYVSEQILLQNIEEVTHD